MDDASESRGRTRTLASIRLTGALVAALVMVGAPLPTFAQAPQSGQHPAPDTVQAIEVQARTIDRFRSSGASGQKFGRLEFRGGLVMTSGSRDFGGISGIAIEPDGKRFLAVGDAGSWIAGEIAYRDRAPIGLVKVRLGAIRALKGRHLDKKRDLDAEAIAPLDGNLMRGHVLIGFERNHRVGLFPVADGALQPPTRYLKLPAEARRMSSNKGFEAVAALKGGPFKGSVVAFSERFPGDDSRHRGWIWVKDQPHAFTLADHAGFEVTDAASTDTGALLILERRFRWTEGVKMRLRMVPADEVKPGAQLDGEILLEADMSAEIDNMEGLAVHKAGGETVLTLVSDNNFNSFLQRNLLLQFTLNETGKAASRR